MRADTLDLYQWLVANPSLISRPGGTHLIAVVARPTVLLYQGSTTTPTRGRATTQTQEMLALLDRVLCPARELSYLLVGTPVGKPLPQLLVAFVCPWITVHDPITSAAACAIASHFALRSADNPSHG
jgi:hypothetical protein